MVLMRIIPIALALTSIACATTAPQSTPDAPARPVDPSVVAAASGVDPTVAEDGGVKISWRRTEVEVSIDGQAFPPAAGLTSWATFVAGHGGAIMMGDTVVFEDEVDAAMDAAFAAGLDVTALHNHFFFDEPKVYFMHIGGHGDLRRLADGVKAVWDAVKTVRSRSRPPAQRFPGGTVTQGTIDALAIEKILGYPAPPINGVVRATVAREGRMHGISVGESMGLTTWAAFTGSDALASVAGDFIMTAREVQPVLRALRRSGIHVVALHNHMIGDEPAFYFTHFWGKGAAADLARGVRAALDAQRRVQR